MSSFSLALALALVIHAFGLVLLTRGPRWQESEAAAARPMQRQQKAPVAVRLLLASTPLPTRSKGQPSAGKPFLPPARKRANRPSKARSQSLAPMLGKGLTYAQLLPPGLATAAGLPRQESSGGDGGKEGQQGQSKERLAARFGGPRAQAIDISAATLSFAFKIPYQWRAQRIAGKARAQLRLTAQGLYLRSLAGEPLLRAVLWQGLREASNLAELRHFIALMKIAELTLELKFEAATFLHEQGSDHKIKWDVKGSLLRMTYVSFASTGDSPWSLPDPYVEKDKRWDRAALHALQENPAFLHAMRNEWLN